MNGIKTDIIYSLNKPQLCSSCVETLLRNRIDKNIINNAQKELIKIRKAKYYRILGWIKRKPIWTLVISSIVAILLGMMGSILSAIIMEYWI
jgi:hypothetical protein